MDRDTLIVHAGFRRNTEPGPFLGGPQFSSTYTAPGDPADHALTYGRFHNPTWTAWEEALGVLEGGQAVAFASGMAAVNAVFGVTLRPGDVVVLPSDSYYSVRRVAAPQARMSSTTAWNEWSPSMNTKSREPSSNRCAASRDGSRIGATKSVTPQEIMFLCQCGKTSPPRSATAFC